LVFELNESKFRVTPKGEILWVIWYMLTN
jgi:hypothetical protein